MSSFMDFFKGKLSSLSSRDAVDGVRADSNGARQANAYANAGAASNSYASSALQELRRRLEDRNTWIPDAVSSDCYSCQAKFTTIRRKHHCRMCGQIFCSKCCGNFIAGRPLGFPGSIRVCVLCHEYITKNLSLMSAAESNASKRSSRAEEASEMIDPGGGGGGGRLRDRRDSVRSALDIQFAAEEAAQEALVEDVAQSSESFRLSDPRMLRQLTERIAKLDEGVPLGTKIYQGGAFHNCFTGRELVEWIRQQDCFITDERSAKVLGQALLGHGYIRTFVEGGGNGEFRSDDVPYSTTPLDEVKVIEYKSLSGSPLAPASPVQDHQPSEVGSVQSPDMEEEISGNFPEWIMAVESGSSADASGRHRRRRDKSQSKDKRTAPGPDTPESPRDRPDAATFSASGYMGQFGPKSRNERKKSNEDVSVEDGTKHLYAEHVRKVVEKLLLSEGLDKEKWLSYILEVTEKIAWDVDPYATMDEVDVRRFLKVKKFPGGEPSDSSYVSGEIFSNRIVASGPRPNYKKPKIVLVGGAVRPKENDDKVVQVAPLPYREKEYANAFCKRVLDLAPDLLLVEDYANRLVRQTLEADGIEIISKIKASSLRRISRYFSIPIFRESPDVPPGGAEEVALQGMVAGTCESVYRLDCSTPSEGKEFVVIDGGPKEYGCTILLRGGSIKELTLVKQVIWRSLPYQRNARFEPEFLMASWAKPMDVPVQPLQSEELSISPFVRLHCRDGVGSSCSDYPREKSRSPKKVRSEQRPNILQKPQKEHVKEIPQSRRISTEQVEKPRKYSRADKRRRLAQARTDCALKTLGGKENQSPEGDEKEKSLAEAAAKLGDHSGSYFHVLFCSYDLNSAAAPHHCIFPFPFKVTFYGSMDLSLGKFLEEFVLRSDYKCHNAKICKANMVTHMRNFCFGNNSVRLSVSTIDENAFDFSEGGHHDIIMWKYCSVCQLATPMAPLNKEAYNYSFGMFLILLMNERKMKRRGSTAKVCQHLVNREQLTCFAKKGGYVATFQHFDISCPQLLLPPKRLSVPEPLVDADSLSEDATMIGTHGKMIYSAIFDEIKRIMNSGVPLLEETAGTYLEEQTRSHNEFRELMNTLTAFQQQNDYLQEGRALVFKIKTLLHRTQLNWRNLVGALQEKGRKEVLQASADSRSRKESGHGKDTGAIAPSSGSTSLVPSGGSSSAETASVPSAALSKAKLEEMLTPLQKNHDYIYKPQFSDTHHYCLSASQKHVVDERQISTIISYALATPDHKNFLQAGLDRLSAGSSAEVEASGGKAAKSLQKSHFHLSFSDEACKFFCCSYFACEFQRLRATVFDGGDGLDDFVLSLSECQAWENSGGKSGSAFYKTRDDRFILKEMNSYEANASSLEPFLAGYFDYMHRSVESEEASCIAKILGVYKVAVNNFVTGNSYKMDLLVIENIFYGWYIQEKFDLKGSIRNRMVNTSNTSTVADSNLVLWDENLLKTMCERPIYLTCRENSRMLEAINNDTRFLRSNHMMDYSMLVGLTKDRREIVVGIVDYIRAFTWDKKVEQILKQTGILGRGDRRQPTCVDPGLYMERFKEAMYKYFIPVPDSCFREVVFPVNGGGEGAAREELPAATTTTGGPTDKTKK